ncbi:hypothetical protein COMNV_01063 [Commensalibacter sp. Nvir]|uniref:OmpW/AlkL family protein n=1 Tax=Commensalibacter sp. Nvir TaxID=3069817 RepID=UPI002D4189C5|nr:hypothetical protein COMNV_01063 [Commensalibacter sp. Nvir]
MKNLLSSFALYAFTVYSTSVYAQTPANVILVPNPNHITATNNTVTNQAPGKVYVSTQQPFSPKKHCSIFQTCPGVTKIGLSKGDFIIRLSALGVIPNNTSSKTSIGGHITASNRVMPELSANYFVTDNLAFEIIAASTKHKITAKNTTLGDVNVGNSWILPPTLTAQWHFLPHKAFNPYAGIGLTVAFWHHVSPGGGAVQKLGLETTAGPSFNIGFDYQVIGNWFFNVDAKQMLLNERAHINDSPNRIDARTSLNPTTVSAGIGYRF